MVVPCVLYKLTKKDSAQVKKEKQEKKKEWDIAMESYMLKLWIIFGDHLNFAVREPK